MSEVRDRPHRDVSSPRLAEVLGGLGLLHDDSTAAVRALIERVTGELAPGFAGPARRWLLVLPGGGPRAKPRSQATIYAYSAAARPILQEWGRTYDHLREVTPAGIYTALEPMSGYPRRKQLAHCGRCSASRSGTGWYSPTRPWGSGPRRSIPG